MSNVLVLSGHRRSASRAPALACLPELFTQRRHDPGDVRWLKENAEFLRLMVATRQVLDPDILARSYGLIARELPTRLSFFPQYYRFFLAIAQDLVALGLPGLDADMLTHQAMARGAADGELSDLQRAEARLLAGRAGMTTGFDPLLSERLLQFAGHSATFALPNRKAAYELTHIAFYLTDYGRHELAAGVRLRDSLEYVGLIAWLDQDVDLLAEVCLALRFCGQSPPGQWEDWVTAMLARFALVPMPDAAGQDDYHAWLMAAWAVAAAGGAPLAITMPVETFGFVAPPVASVLGEISAALFDLGPRRTGEWGQLRWQLAGRLSAAALDLLDQGAAATPRFAALHGRVFPWAAVGSRSMTRLRPGVAILGGVALIFGVTLAGAAADGATKHLAGRIAAPQLYFFAGLGVALISLAFERALPAAGAGGRLTTRFGRLLALRSLLVVASTLFYYHAFARLPLAEVFVFIGLTPLLAAGAAYPVLGERVAPTGWLAIMLGGVGVLFLFPGGIGAVSSGHWLAAGGVITGTLSLVLMRRMTRSEDNALAQVFWPHVAMAVVMGLALPTAWQPMSLIDGLLVGGYVLAVFLSRRLLVPAVTRLRVHVAMMLLNLQFLWMVGLDRLAFDQGLAAGTLAGAGCIILAGCALVAEQARQDRPDRPRIATSPALAQPRLHPAE